MRGVRSLGLAVTYLTIAPLPVQRVVGGEALGRAAPWFPVVGLGIGAVVMAADAVGTRVFSALLATLLTVTLWKVVTGGLHLDGLADCLDGLVGADPAQRLAIMHDSRVGAFGVVGLILFLMLEIAALVELDPAVRWRALLVAPVVGRAMPPLIARALAPARADGQGATFRAGLSTGGVLVALGIAVVAAGAGLGLGGGLALLAAGLAALGLAWFLARRLGGITGDVLGASVEVGELVVLLSVAAWSHAPR